MNSKHRCGPPCGRVSRRTFLADVGMGFTGLALSSMLFRDSVARADHEAWQPPDGQPHFAPKAKTVIWIFLSGGYSHMETFDPKPALTRYAGKSYDETTLPNPQKSPLFEARSRSVTGGSRMVYSRIFPLQVGFKKHGRAGVEVSDWWPHLATCVDDLAFVRSMYTTDNDHAAEFQFHHGRHHLDDTQPSIGAWVHYGLGKLNENLPQYLVLGPLSDPRQKEDFQCDYLGPQHAGVHLALDGDALPFGSRGRGVLAREQQNEYEAVRRFNELAGLEYPADENLRARVKAYELAFRMQTAVPEALALGAETKETQALYGLDDPATAVTGRRLLAARRLAERGVRFLLVQLSNYGEWDSHQHLQKNHAASCGKVDKPVAGLIKDLKRRGMLDDTLVVFGTEFGRTPAVQDGKFAPTATGRDHHPHGFTVWFAGAGIKPGTVHGATDELGFHAVEHPHYVTDVHATVYHLLGLDPRRLDVPGRKRLEVDYGRTIKEILA